MPYVRSAWLDEIRPFLYFGEYPIPEGFALRKTRHGPIEVRKEIRLTLKWRGKNGQLKSAVWRARPGMVLTIRYRRPTKWEEEELKRPTEDRLPLPKIKTIKNRRLIPIVEKDSDLYSAGRRFLRHMASSLVTGFNRKARREPGWHFISAEWLNLIYQTILNLTSNLTVSSKRKGKTIRLLSQILNALAKTKREDLAEAKKMVEKALTLSGTKRVEALSRALGLVGAYRLEVFQQAIGSAEKGLAILEIIQQIDSGIRLIYEKNIPKLLRQLRPYAVEGRPITPYKLLQIAQQVLGLYHYIQRICAFDPYTSRARSAQIRRLAHSLDYAESGDVLGLYRSLARAHAKLEALVLGECPVPEEAIVARQFTKRLSY